MRCLCLILVASICTGCASVSGRDRTLWGVGLGAGVGAAGGAAFSPNRESQGINALVFGLAGALVGGVTAILSDTRPTQEKGRGTLRERDQSFEKTTREFEVFPASQLPAFIKDRVQPMVIEESIESDTVAEDGTLHEPHKVYRIKRPGELFAKPSTSPEGAKQ